MSLLGDLLAINKQSAGQIKVAIGKVRQYIGYEMNKPDEYILSLENKRVYTSAAQDRLVALFSADLQKLEAALKEGKLKNIEEIVRFFQTTYTEQFTRYKIEARPVLKQEVKQEIKETKETPAAEIKLIAEDVPPAAAKTQSSTLRTNALKERFHKGFLMGTHPRAGSDSSVKKLRNLDKEVLKRVFNFLTPSTPSELELKETKDCFSPIVSKGKFFSCDRHGLLSVVDLKNHTTQTFDAGGGQTFNHNEILIQISNNKLIVVHQRYLLNPVTEVVVRELGSMKEILSSSLKDRVKRVFCVGSNIVVQSHQHLHIKNLHNGSWFDFSKSDKWRLSSSVCVNEQQFVVVYHHDETSEVLIKLYRIEKDKIIVIKSQQIKLEFSLPELICLGDGNLVMVAQGFRNTAIVRIDTQKLVCEDPWIIDSRLIFNHATAEAACINPRTLVASNLYYDISSHACKTDEYLLDVEARSVTKLTWAVGSSGDGIHRETFALPPYGFVRFEHDKNTAPILRAANVSGLLADPQEQAVVNLQNKDLGHALKNRR